MDFVFPKKSGTNASMITSGAFSLIARMVSEKCPAPPSLKSSLLTEVKTAYFKSI